MSGYGREALPNVRAPLLAPAQPISVVERVADLVSQDARQPVRVAALDLAHEAPLQPLQARMRHVERHRDAGYAVRREPFLGQPHMRPEADAARTAGCGGSPACWLSISELRNVRRRSQKRVRSNSASDRRVHAGSRRRLRRVLTLLRERAAIVQASMMCARASATARLRRVAAANRPETHRCRSVRRRARRTAPRRPASLASCSRPATERRDPCAAFANAAIAVRVTDIGVGGAVRLAPRLVLDQVLSRAP